MTSSHRMPVAESPEVKGEWASAEPVIAAVIASILRRSKRDADVRDGVQETFRRAIEGGGRVLPNSSQTAWLIGIARHVAVDMLRAQKRHLRSIDDDAASISFEPTTSEPNAFDRLDTAERTRMIQRALEQLPEVQRRALIAFHVDGLRYEAIARECGVSMGTVATWISRGRKFIAEALSTEEGL